MEFEFMYSFSTLFLIFVAEFVSLKWVETKEIQQIEKYLNLKASPQFITAGIIYAFLIVFFIPKNMGFETNTIGMSVAVLLYFVWSKNEGEPRLLILKRRVNEAAMEKRGVKGFQMADLKVRHMRDYLPAALILIPYLMLLASGLILYIWIPSQSYMQIEKEYSIGLLILLLGLGVTLVLNWQMQKLLKEPLDLRSSVPQEFIKKIHLYIRDRLRIFLILQISFVILMLTFMASNTFGLPYGYRFEIGVVSVYLVGVGSLMFIVRNSMLRLEEQRWQESD